MKGGVYRKNIMNKFQKRIVSAAASAAILLNALTPAFAATTLEITGNTNDDNTVSLNQNNTTSVSQNNNASVTNVITATANTGDNDANRNAGGDVSIDTGSADVNVAVDNQLNTNVADVERCNGCGVGDVAVNISGNANDDNTANVGVTNTTVATQTNNADVYNDVYTSSNTGGNRTNKNTGGVEVNTGDASTDTTVTNTLNNNALTIGGEGDGNGVSVMIAGNTNDDNTVNLAANASTWVAQANNAYVDNIVTTHSNTGDNDAYKNAGGSVSIDTGDAETDVTVENTLNGNSAQIMGDGSSSVEARIVGNANWGDNDIDLDLAMNTTVFQNNNADVLNVVYADSDSGNNTAKKNAGGDVSIETGDATVDVDVETAANFNVADVQCDCLFDDVLAKIAGNTNDDNHIAGSLDDGLFVNQGNCGYYYGQETLNWGWYQDPGCQTTNVVTADGATGDNNIKSNAGETYGDPSVSTGDVDMNLNASTSGNTNVYGEAPEGGFPFSDHANMDFHFTFDMEFWQAFMQWWDTNHA